MSIAQIDRAGSCLSADPVFPAPAPVLIEWFKPWEVTFKKDDTCRRFLERLKVLGIEADFVDGLTHADIDDATHEREPKVSPYRFECARNEGAETRYLEKDCGEIHIAQVRGITLLERLAIEHINLLQAGGLIDRRGTATLCVGTYVCGKFVPTVRFNAESLKIEIGKVALNVSRSNLATRRVYVTALL